jgi:hypothetical protein
MPFVFGFVEARSYDRRVYDEQMLLERWRKDIVVSDYPDDLAERARKENRPDLALTDDEWKVLRRRLVCDGIEGPRTQALRNLKRRIF